MKKLTLVAVLVLMTVLQQGCSNKYKNPNTYKGQQLDAINRHTQNITEVNPIIYDQNEHLLPQKIDQVGDQSAFQSRMRARMQGMKGGK